MTSSGAAFAEKAGEAPQVAEHRHHLGAAALEHTIVALSINEFGHLRREEPLQLGDALLALLRHRQFGGHGVEAVGQPLKFVAGPDLDPMVELPGADALGAFLELADRLRHPARQRKGKQPRNGHAAKQKSPSPPQGRIDRPERLQERLLDHDRPIGTRDRRSGRRNGSALCILTGRRSAPRAQRLLGSPGTAPAWPRPLRAGRG